MSLLEDHRDFVGPKANYDLMGAIQFSLLIDKGLREHHTLLDVGCGSLRAGRFFIMYLGKEKYFGIEPNRWVLDKGMDEEIGKDLCDKKKPSFDFNSEFDCTVFNTKFDYILAQSILTHASRDQMAALFESASKVMTKGSMLIANFKEGSKSYDGKEWVYPACISYSESFISTLASKYGLVYSRLPDKHPIAPKTAIWFSLVLK